MTGPTDRAYAEALDAADPLAEFRDRFVIGDPNFIYMDGNSLGRLPRETADRVRRLVEDEWGAELVAGWDRWMELAREVGDILASKLVGAGPGEVILSDSTTVNLYKLASAALDASPGRTVILSDGGNFPSDLYVFQALTAQRGLELRLVEADPVRGPDAAGLAPLLDEKVALVTFSHVNYRSGALADMDAVTAAAHEAGAMVLWDLSHSAGAVPVGLNACEADLAVGCTYKYLNGGPGSPAFLYVRSDLQERLRQPIWGWFGQRDQFAFGRSYEPAPDIRRYLVGTPPIVSMAAVQVGIGLVAEAGIERLRQKSVGLTSMMVALFDAWLGPLGFELGTHRLPARRGAHLALRHPDGYRICRALIERCKVVPDFRPPDVIRYGPAPIYTRFVDAWDAMERLREAVAKELHLEFDPAPV